jgi:hypothetical protein
VKDEESPDLLFCLCVMFVIQLRCEWQPAVEAFCALNLCKFLLLLWLVSAITALELVTYFHQVK